MDKSDDPMTQLLILTHPSTGVFEFNASGTGSIDSTFKNRDDLMQIISGIFKTASETRKLKITKVSKYLKEEFIKYFGDTANKVYDEELIEYFRTEIDIIQRTLEQASEAASLEELIRGKVIVINNRIKKMYEAVVKENKEETNFAGNKGKLISDLDNSLAVTRNTLKKVQEKGALSEDESRIRKKAEAGIKNRKQEKLSLLINAIVGAISLECTDENDRTKPYKLGYTNDIICTYACGVISGQSATTDLNNLAEKLAKNMETPNVKPYESELTKIVWLNDMVNSSYVPFLVGQKIISNSHAYYSGVENGEAFSHKFTDCVETTMRQLFSLLFCSGYDYLETERIPERSALRKFFESRNARDVANSGEKSVRDEWANICSGHTNKGLLYGEKNQNKNGGCELVPCWKNMIKVFCLLMNDYSAEKDKEVCGDRAKKRKKAAENCIRDITENKLDVTSDNIIEILNILLGIRGDIELEAIERSKLSKVGAQITGDIIVRPKEKKFQPSNEVPFNPNNGLKILKNEGVKAKPQKNKIRFSHE